MPYIKLIKLLYLADRRMIQKRGRAITGDSYYSVKCGPILSETLEAIKLTTPDWSDLLGADLEARIVWLKSKQLPARLSNADIEVLEWVSANFGHWSWPKLVRFTHRLKEWTKPADDTKRTPITLADIGRGLGLTPERIEQIAASRDEADEVQPLIDSLRASA